MRRLIVLALILFSAACHLNRPIPTDALRYNLQTEPPTLDWSIATDNASVLVLVNIMEGLTRYDKDLNPVPAIAQSWEVSEDGKKYTFHLRPAAAWR